MFCFVFVLGPWTSMLKIEEALSVDTENKKKRKKQETLDFVQWGKGGRVLALIKVFSKKKITQKYTIYFFIAQNRPV